MSILHAETARSIPPRAAMDDHERTTAADAAALVGSGLGTEAEVASALRRLTWLYLSVPRVEERIGRRLTRPERLIVLRERVALRQW